MALDRRVLVIGIVVILVVGGGAVILLLQQGGQPPTPQGKELVIITRHDSSIEKIFEDAYLSSDYAKDYGITSVSCICTPVDYWWATI